MLDISGILNRRRFLSVEEGLGRVDLGVCAYRSSAEGLERRAKDFNIFFSATTLSEEEVERLMGEKA